MYLAQSSCAWGHHLRQKQNHSHWATFHVPQAGQSLQSWELQHNFVTLFHAATPVSLVIQVSPLEGPCSCRSHSELQLAPILTALVFSESCFVTTTKGGNLSSSNNHPSQVSKPGKHSNPKNWLILNTVFLFPSQSLPFWRSNSQVLTCLCLWHPASEPFL